MAKVYEANISLCTARVASSWPIELRTVGYKKYATGYRRILSNANRMKSKSVGGLQETVTRLGKKRGDEKEIHFRDK